MTEGRTVRVRVPEIADIAFLVKRSEKISRLFAAKRNRDHASEIYHANSDIVKKLEAELADPPEELKQAYQVGREASKFWAFFGVDPIREEHPNSLSTVGRVVQSEELLGTDRQRPDKFRRVLEFTEPELNIVLEDQDWTTFRFQAADQDAQTDAEERRVQANLRDELAELLASPENEDLADLQPATAGTVPAPLSPLADDHGLH